MINLDKNNKDALFLDPQSRSKDFAFNDDVVAVFDDMITRSVPFYREIQMMILELAKEYVKDNTNIYDLGCSTGTTLALLISQLKNKTIQYLGLDYSDGMLKKTSEKLAPYKEDYSINLLAQDFNKDLKLENCSFAVLNLVMQFVKPENRVALLKNIYDGLLKGGMLVIIEKVETEFSESQGTFTNLYHNFKKRQGYTEEEIANKKESLKNILNPFSNSQNIALAKSAGFTICEPFFQWYNFAGYLAQK
jgi:tRNA (cmo5U34)-methyltransferase